MKLLTKLLLFLFLVEAGIGSAAYGQRCKTVEVRNANIARNPAILDEMQRINEFTERWSANPQRRGAVVTVPVVVHVIWNTAAQNISDAQINSQITVLNDDFRKMNSDFSSTPTPFQGIAADSEIEFCLATVDPSGNPTTGITRTQTSTAAIGDTEDWYQTANGGHDPWDNSKYLNIWVCDLGPGLLGFATPPGTAMPAASDGAVIAPQYFGTVGTAVASNPNHLGRTATHELGHYFNLEHVWGPSSGGCGEDDFVMDTPLQDQSTYGCPTFPLLDNCTTTGNGVNFSNFMDYVDDGCMTMFSQGQKTRMLAALNGPRASLLSSNGCSGPVAVDPAADFANSVQVYPNPSNRQVNISLNNPKKLNFALTDMLGKKHMEFKIDRLKTIDVSGLPQGIYFLTCEEYPNSVKKLLVTK